MDKTIRELKQQADYQDKKRLAELESQMKGKQLAFCQYYIINKGNGAAAARDAGYSGNHAREIAASNLTKVHIRDYIEIFAKLQDDSRIANAQEVLRFLTAEMRGEVEILSQKMKVKGEGDSKETEITSEKIKPGHHARILAGKTLGEFHGLWKEGGIDMRNSTIEITIDGEAYGEVAEDEE